MLDSLPRKQIWVYWENKPGHDKPWPYIELCWRTLRESSPECTITLVTPDNLDEFLPDLPREATTTKDIEAPDGNSIVHRCDIVRCLLLEKYGGLYIDSDAVVLRDLTQIFELLQQWEFVGLRRTSVVGRHIPVGFYASRAGGKVITAYANRLRRKIAEQTHFTWAELGAAILTPIVNSSLESCYLIPESMIFPIGPARYELLLSEKEPIAPYVSSNPIVFMLFNRYLEEEVGHWSEDRLMSSDILLSKLFRHAFALKNIRRDLPVPMNSADEVPAAASRSKSPS